MPFFIAVFACLGALFWMIAWLNPDHGHPWVTFMNEASMELALMCATLAALAQVRPSGWAPCTASTRIVLVLAALMVAAQWCLGVDSTQAVTVGALICLSMALAGELGHRLAAQPQMARDRTEHYGLAALAFTALLSAGVVLIQALDVRDYYPDLVADIGDNRPFGNLGQPNNQATFLAMGMVALDLMATRRLLAWRTAVPCMLLLMMALVATGSRAGLLGALLSGAYLCWRRRAGFRNATVLWMSCLMALTVLHATWLPKLLHVTTARSIQDLYTDNIRVVMYKSLMQAIARQPWLGAGLGNTGQAQADVALHQPAGAAVAYAHCLPLDLLIWFGLPFGGLLIAWAIWRLAAGWRRAGESQKTLMAIVIPFAFHSLVELPYAYGFFLLTVALIWGYAAAPVGDLSRTATPRTASTPRWIFAALTALNIVLGVAVAWEYILLVEDYSVARFSMRRVGSRPPGHADHSAVLLDDVGDQVRALNLVIGPDLGAEDLRMLRRQAYNNHLAIASMKLVQYHLFKGDLESVNQELMRFTNMYRNDGPTLAWAHADLIDATCGGGPLARPDRCALAKRWADAQPRS